ncbi:hypothetical protein ACH5RR_022840 [Cinchona calisaya]|uniref:F-box domain-containing protein n=1 Tax=Cinchona calisaya TaxID=153742 RepID=A0ABD2Z8Y8_9GENT
MDKKKLVSVTKINSNFQQKLVERDNLFLPFKIITAILLFLPPKSLAKFMGVAKSWKNLITNPIFVDQYPSKSALKEYFGTNICLRNPSIRKYKVVPSSILDIESTRDVLGFGYVAETNDYKVTPISITKLGHLAKYKTKVEVYSLSADSWKEIETISVPWYIFKMSSEVLLNESLHWMAMDWGNTRELAILSFDLKKEVFKLIGLPAYEKPQAIKALEFFDSWAKLYNIRLEAIIDRPPKFTNRGEIILYDARRNSLVYNIDNRRSWYGQCRMAKNSGGILEDEQTWK